MSTAFELSSSDPRQRDPTSHPYGLYLVNSMSNGGSQGFYWFRSNEDAVNYLIQLLDLDSDEEFYNSKGELLDCTPPDMLVQEINQQQCKFTIRWSGPIEELLTSQSRFAREIRADFNAISVPISMLEMHESMRKSFIVHLHDYAEHFPERAHRSPYKPILRNWL